jgi:hypothetical protein
MGGIVSRLWLWRMIVPVLKNARHERFAQELAKGSSQEAAYVAAGYSKVGASGHAARLVANGSVADRVLELKQRAAEKVEWGIADAVKELEEARLAALSAETPQASAAVSATRAKLEALGLKPADKHEHSGGVSIQYIAAPAPAQPSGYDTGAE